MLPKKKRVRREKLSTRHGQSERTETVEKSPNKEK